MKYKGFLLATAGGMAAIPGAQAADLPMKSPAVAPPPVSVAPSWEGFYLGVSAGIASQTAKYDARQSGYASYANNANTTGFIGGGQLGYNWQRGVYVFGLEADISGLTGRASQSPLSNTGKGPGFQGRIDWLSTFRGRVGWLANPNTLLYATGGLAVGGVKDSFNINGLNSSGNATKSVSKTRAGWTLGGGIETMLDAHWLVGVEALYVDLGKNSTTINTGAGNGNPSQPKTTSFKNEAVIARGRLSYKF